MNLPRAANYVWMRADRGAKTILTPEDLTQAALEALVLNPRAPRSRLWGAMVDEVRRHARNRRTDDGSYSRYRVFSLTRLAPDQEPAYHDDLDHARAPGEHAALYAAISALAPLDALVVILYFWYGWPRHRIGATFGVTEARISQRRTRILRTLRQQLASLEEAA